MNEFKDTVDSKETAVSDRFSETDRFKIRDMGAVSVHYNAESMEDHFSEMKNAFDSIYKRYGLVDDAESEKDGNGRSDAADAQDYSQHLEKRDDGKYYDKETGKSYDSVEQWEKAQETLAKRYEGTANYYEEKAKKEWARFKNAEENGESDAEKWEHYRRANEYYAKAKECKEAAEKIRARLGHAPSDSSESISDDVSERNGLIEAVPPDRQGSVRDMCDGAPDKIKEIIRQYGKGLIIEDTPDNYPICHYDRADGVIRMEKKMDNDEYAEVLSHEFGHLVDHSKNDFSVSQEFKDAVAKDTAQYNRFSIKGGRVFFTMLDDVIESDAAYDRAISDNLSAYFRNDSTVKNKFFGEGIAFYGHSDEYWDRQGNKEREIYANCFSMFTQNNAESCDFMKKYFPNTWDAFMNSL